MDCVLRYHPNGWPPKSLVIAVLAFDKQKKNHGRRFVRELCRLAELYDYENIGIESPNDDAIAIAKRFHLKPLGNRCFAEAPRKWLIPISKLSR